MNTITEVSYLSEFTTIFVSVGEGVEKVQYGMDVKFGEFSSDTRPDPFKLHNRG